MSQIQIMFYMKQACHTWAAGVPVQYLTASQTLQTLLFMVAKSWWAGTIMGVER